MEEIWKDIKFIDKNIKYDFTGFYQVSNYGRIKSLERITTNNHKVYEKILKTRIDKDGYKIISLRINNKLKDFKVHRLVAFMFLDNPKKYTQVNHKDENKQNNYYKNLNWCSPKENANYGSRNKKIGKAISQYDLDSNFIRNWNCAYEVYKRIGFDSSCICKCLKGKTKTSYGYIWKYN